ncbi:diacylglycerol kinase [bacterium]|nr:diacylglycerol kinase [bacterium]
MKNQYSGTTRIIRAFGNSIAGLRAAFTDEAAFRQDLLLCIAGTVLLIFIDLGLPTKALLFLSLLTIIIAELINTAIENAIDRIGPEDNPYSKKAKDIGSAVVLLTITGVITLWVIVIFLY